MKNILVAVLFVLSAFVLLVGAIVGARAASTSLALNLTVPVVVSASVTCTPVQALFPVPVVAGTKMATCVVAPSGWTGSVALSGADAAPFVSTLSGVNVTINVGASPITVAKTYNVTVTSTP